MFVRLMFLPALLLVLAAFASQSLYAEEETHGSAAEVTEHPYHKHVLGLFVGGAAEEFGRRDNGFVLGLDYEYRFSPSFGVGAIFEHTYGDLDIYVYAIPFAYHTGRWKIYVAPGIEEGEGGAEQMLRVGAEYGFHAGKWEISPQVDIDFVERERDVFVVGVTFARSFDL